MKNKTTTYKWAYLPFVFSSAAILATHATAAPTGSQQYQDAKQVNSINQEYVGGDHSVGFGVDDEGNVDAEINAAISRSDNHRTGVGLWAGFDLSGDDDGIQGRGGEINHAWTSKDAAGNVTRVNKAFVAYDRNQAGNDRATVGYGQENENLFWDGRVSRGLGGGTNERLDANDNIITDRAYEWGVGASVGKFLPGSNARIRAGIDHEWSQQVGSGESNARNTTLSAGVEKFFQGTGHSVSLDVAGSRSSGGARFDQDEDDTDFTGRLGYKYDFGGSSIYQPDRRYRRVRVEVPGQAVAPRFAQKQQFKKVPTFKSVPVYGNKTVRTPYKQLVKSTMELEGQTFFKLNSSKLIPSAQTRLKQIAAQIRKTGYKGSIRITGNTCGLGDARYDQILSEKRAKEVRNFLIKNGFNPDHLVARGLGKGHPKYDRTPGQDFKNRRVDIEYVTQQQVQKTAYKTETKKVQTGTRQVATGFKNVPAGLKNVLVSNGKPGAPRVIWKTEAIPSSPAWIQRALNNTIEHDRNVNTFATTFGNDAPVAPVNVGPVANNDAASTACLTPVSIDVLGNDTDADNDDLTITSFTQPANGTITRGADGQLVYTPNSLAACGTTESFTYTISDGNGGVATATATVNVGAPVNIDPEAQNDSAVTPEGTPVTLAVLDNDTSNSGSNQLTITSVGNPSNGTAEIVNGQIVYTPNADFVGTDSFTYTITDSNGETATATATVTITAVDDVAPEAQNDSAVTPEGTPVTLPVLDNDVSNSGSNQLTITSVGDPSNGSAEIVNGQIVYTPNADFVGTDSFTYTITDSNGVTATAIATVTITAVDDVAPEAQDDTAVTPEGTPVRVPVLDNDTSNSGSNQLTITSVGDPSNGTAEIVNGQIVYTPNADFVGTDSFTYTITDSNGVTATATATVTITAADDIAPDAIDDTAVTPEGTPVRVPVLDNDTSNSGSNQLTITSVGDPSNGTAVIRNGQIIYTPNADFVGTDRFTYTITDSNGVTATATATVTITAVADIAPEAQDDSVETSEGTAVKLPVLDNDTSNSGSNQLTITSVSSPSNGTAVIRNGQILYTPNAGFVGTDSFTYTITDSNGETATATASVNITAAPNSLPVAKDDRATTSQGEPVKLDTLANDSDADGDTLTITDIGPVANGRAVIVGNQIMYSPNADFVGTETFTYTISDGNGGTATATETVVVTAALNQKPHAVNDFAITGCEVITINVLDNDTDPEGDNLSIVSVDAGGLKFGTVQQAGNQITYRPSSTCSAGNTGTDNFSYTISDGNGNTASGNVQVVVEGVPDIKVEADANADDKMIKMGQKVVLNVLANDTGDGLRITNVSNPENGSARVVNNKIVYQPNAGFTGSDMFTYDIIDQHGNRDWSTIIIDVVRH